MSKIAIVTGANQGLGLALVRDLCERLGDEGVVYLAARDAGRGQAAVDELTAGGLRPRLEIMNVRDSAAVEATAARLAERHGGVDIVISNAAYRMSPDLPQEEMVRPFVDTNNHGTHRMITAFRPVLNGGARFLVVASGFGVLRSLAPHLRDRFDDEHLTLDGLAKIMDDFVDAVETGRDEGWPDWINAPSKVGQVAAMRVLARELAGERGILVNAVCPGLIDTAASRPFFEDMSSALSPTEAAGDVTWLATLPVGTEEPYGELVQYRKVLPFRR